MRRVEYFPGMTDHLGPLVRTQLCFAIYDTQTFRECCSNLGKASRLPNRSWTVGNYFRRNIAILEQSYTHLLLMFLRVRREMKDIRNLGYGLRPRTWCTNIGIWISGSYTFEHALCPLSMKLLSDSLNSVHQHIFFLRWHTYPLLLSR